MTACFLPLLANVNIQVSQLSVFVVFGDVVEFQFDAGQSVVTKVIDDKHLLFSIVVHQINIANKLCTWIHDLLKNCSENDWYPTLTRKGISSIQQRKCWPIMTNIDPLSLISNAVLNARLFLRRKFLKLVYMSLLLDKTCVKGKSY